MANEPNTNQGTPNPQDSGNAGGHNKRLYFGKYESDSLEEATEQSYKGLEKGFHETRQELKEIRELLESRLAPTEGDEYGRDGRSNYNPVVDNPNLPSN